MLLPGFYPENTVDELLHAPSAYWVFEYGDGSYLKIQIRKRCCAAMIPITKWCGNWLDALAAITDKSSKRQGTSLG
ncbi:hypothetical protein FACS189431_4020 [Alphaproteobacteria bacterium]|nr:hypothetical protein FACS189431_4020 [Alphaproteobacteria bacterium]